MGCGGGVAALHLVAEEGIAEETLGAAGGPGDVVLLLLVVGCAARGGGGGR